MKIIDITKEMLSAEVYPGDTAPTVKSTITCEKGGFNTSDLTCCLHNGTHVDAPRHIDDKGIGANGIPLEKCFGKCAVITVNGKLDLKKVSQIKKTGLKKIILRGAEITPAAAFELSFLHLELIGTEAQSVGGLNVHKTFLKSGTVILEGVDLSRVQDGEYVISAFPLKINGADGTPVRAVLISE